MNHSDHVDLIREGVMAGLWADLGSGGGAFTLALADILGADQPQTSVQIISVDRDRNALVQQKRVMMDRFPAARMTYQEADFTRRLALPLLDGVLVANALHFVRDRAPVLALIREYLKPDGRLIVVEYDADRGNLWVPHPFSYTSWQRMATAAGFRDTRLLGRRPSRFLDAIYSAVSTR